LVQAAHSPPAEKLEPAHVGCHGGTRFRRNL
jgi:hypothetical protein